MKPTKKKKKKKIFKPITQIIKEKEKINIDYEIIKKKKIFHN
jgi:predicted DNA-binding transcriptional regulator YafY